MREYRVDHGSSYGAGQGAGARDLAKEKTPQEWATERAYRLRQEAESAAARAKKLPAIVQRDEWRTEQASLKQTYAALVEQLKERAADAHAPAQAQRHHEAAARELGEIKAALASAKEPRAMPPVHGEEAIEPQIVERTIQADDVLAWVAELGSGQRRALADRVRRVQGSADRSDSFSVALANYLAATRIMSQFFGVAENPRRFNRAAYEKARAGARAADAAAGTHETTEASRQASDTDAAEAAAHGAGVRLPPITAAPMTHVQLAPKLFVPDPDLSPHAPTILVPDANHPARRDIDGEQVIQTGATTAPGKPTSVGGRSWKSLAEVAESAHIQDDAGDTLCIDITYRLESRPAEVGEVPDIWIHTERKALLTIGSGEHAGATIVGQARIRLAPGEPRDPKAAIGKSSIGPDHWAQIYLSEAGQYVNLHGPGGRASLRADAADSDVLAYDDPLRTLIGLKNILKQQHVASHGGDIAKLHARAQRAARQCEAGSRGPRARDRRHRDPPRSSPRQGRPASLSRRRHHRMARGEPASWPR